MKQTVSMKIEAIPPQLKARPQWVCWKYWAHPSRPKPLKLPLNPRTQRAADISKPETWSSFEEAHAILEATGQYDGLGIVLTRDDGLVGVDIDGCINADGELSQTARRVVDLVESYTEVSPSGRGLRIFAEAELGDFGGRRRGKVELYNHSRYLTVTGNHLAGTPSELHERLTALRELYRLYLQPPKSQPSAPERVGNPVQMSQTDEEVTERMFGGKLGELYREIYHGDLSHVYSGGEAGTPDESRADVLLFNALAFYTGQDAGQMRRILLGSPRAGQRMEKWERRVSGETSYLDYQIADSIRYARKR